MNIALGHMDWAPVFYGLALFFSVMSMAWKIKRSKYLGFFVEISVVAVILMVHGGSVTGGFAATIAGLLSGMFIPLMFGGAKPKAKAEAKPEKPDVKPVLSPLDIYYMTRK